MTNAANTSDQYQLRIVHDENAQSPREDDNLSTMICWHDRYNLGDKHDYEQPENLFVDLVGNTIPPQDIISYVKDGKADSLILEYNKADKEWDMKVYSSYSDKWYAEYSTPAPLKMDDDVLSDYLINEMQLKDLITLAERTHVILPINLYDHGIQSVSVESFKGYAQHANWDAGQYGWVYMSHEDIKKNFGDISAESIEKAQQAMINEVKTYDSYIRGECYGFQLYKDGEEINSCWGFVGSFDEAKNAIREFLPEDAVKLLDDMDYGDVDKQANANLKLKDEIEQDFDELEM